jgi:hypothetical protein
VDNIQPPVNLMEENRLFFPLTSLFTTTTTTTTTTTKIAPLDFTVQHRSIRRLLVPWAVIALLDPLFKLPVRLDHIARVPL